MMKKRLLAMALCAMAALMLLPCLITPALAAAPAEKLSDETGRKSAEITLSDGTKTGVLWSDISVSGSTYGADRQVNMVEVNLANTHLSMEVLTGGQYGKLLRRMGRRSDAVGFAIYLDRLELLEKNLPEYDVDVLLLYKESDDPAKVAAKASLLVKEGFSVSCQKSVPEKLRYERLLTL
mgnify:CR=1 FL=1